MGWAERSKANRPFRLPRSDGFRCAQPILRARFSSFRKDLMRRWQIWRRRAGDALENWAECSSDQPGNRKSASAPFTKIKNPIISGVERFRISENEAIADTSNILFSSPKFSMDRARSESRSACFRKLAVLLKFLQAAFSGGTSKRRETSDTVGVNPCPISLTISSITFTTVGPNVVSNSAGSSLPATASWAAPIRKRAYQPAAGRPPRASSISRSWRYPAAATGLPTHPRRPASSGRPR